MNTVVAPPLTRVSSRVHRCTKQQHVLCERGVEQTHGAHPAAGVHEHPAQVLVRQDVSRIPGVTHSSLPRGVDSTPQEKPFSDLMELALKNQFSVFNLHIKPSHLTGYSAPCGRGEQTSTEAETVGYFN